MWLCARVIIGTTLTVLIPSNKPLQLTQGCRATGDRSSSSTRTVEGSFSQSVSACRNQFLSQPAKKYWEYFFSAERKALLIGARWTWVWRSWWSWWWSYDATRRSGNCSLRSALAPSAASARSAGSTAAVDAAGTLAWTSPETDNRNFCLHQS